MPQLRHVAITTHDVEKTAKFYIDVFGMKEMGKINDSGTTGCFLSDGVMNLAILHFKNDQAAGVERGAGFKATSASRWRTWPPFRRSSPPQAPCAGTTSSRRSA